MPAKAGIHPEMIATFRLWYDLRMGSGLRRNDTVIA